MEDHKNTEELAPMSDQGEKQEGQKDPKTEEKILFVQEDLHPDEDSREYD